MIGRNRSLVRFDLRQSLNARELVHSINATTEAAIMKFRAELLAAAILLAEMHASHAAIRIAGDRGGLIDSYVDRYQRLRTSGETVIIDGLCASSCTIVLGAVAADKICVTSKAALGFHAAWDFGRKGRTITNPDATNYLYSMYPGPVQRWIAARGGLRPQLILLRGKALQALYKPCVQGRRLRG